MENTRLQVLRCVTSLTPALLAAGALASAQTAPPTLETS